MRKFKLNVTSDFLVNSLCTITIGTGVLEFTANTFLNHYIKSYKEAFKNGNPIKLSESLKKRYDEVVKDIKLTEFQMAFVAPFVVDSLKPTNIGCINTRSGAYIGIPNYFECNSVDELQSLDSEEIQQVNINPEYSEQLMKTLTLSESAKKYAIAHELINTDNIRLYIQAVTPTLVLMPMYAVGHTVFSSLPANPSSIRAFAFFIFCNIGMWFYYIIRKNINDYYQHDTDTVISEMGDEYIKGGLEYYDKLIQRNIILRNILPNGDRIYSEKGDEIGFFAELAFTYRKKHLERNLKKLAEKNTEELPL
ncbi:transmembrane protein 177-like [Adelges cooleyi]|uniref:transmembrane protein 177-like n=1 Tax=Adelges cooleyi TaxID=133065 RepID=UPI00217FD00B|nr:transmembrane protein 177-like [Adelges cooleyi]